MAKKFKERKRELLAEREHYWELTRVLDDLGIDYKYRDTTDTMFSIISFEVTLPQFMAIEKILKAKKIEYRIFRT